MSQQEFSDDELRKRLTPEQYHVLRDRGTEVPFANEFFDFNEKGEYRCPVCKKLLFSSNAKYKSNQWGLEGWPSFAGAVNSDAVKLVEDNSYGMRRTEAVCGNCGSHLGHVFPDYSSPSGTHYCINSAALEFLPDKSA